MHPEAAAHNMAATQEGAITRDQALAAGLSPRQIARMLESGRWSRVTRAGYRLVDISDHDDIVRAAVAVLPDAVASHASAARLLGITGAPHMMPTVTVHSRTTHVFPGTRVVRAHDHLPEHRTIVDEVPTTTAARTIVDLATALRPRRLEAVLDNAVAERITTAQEIGDVLRSVARRGKPGVRVLRSLLEPRIGEARPRSVLERAGEQLIATAGLPAFQCEAPIPWAPMKRFDVAFIEQRVAVEWDSRRWHTLSAAFDSDRRRDQECFAHGWRIVRFTWEDVFSSPDSVVGTLRAILSHA